MRSSGRVSEWTLSSPIRGVPMHPARLSLPLALSPAPLSLSRPPSLILSYNLTPAAAMVRFLSAYCLLLAPKLCDFDVMPLSLLCELRVSPPSSDGSPSAFPSAHPRPPTHPALSPALPGTVFPPCLPKTQVLNPNRLPTARQKVPQDHLARRGGRPPACPGRTGRARRRHPRRHQ